MTATAPAPETMPVSPPQYRRHDDTPPQGHRLSDGPPTPRTDAEQALVDRETLSQVMRELLDARHLGLKAHEDTHAKIDACITDVRTANARLDDVQGKLGEQTGALRSLTDAVVELVEGQKLQTAAILKLERRVARGEEDADDTKAKVAVALGGEIKARESLASYSEITLTRHDGALAEHSKAIADTRSFLDKHFSTKRARWTAALVSSAGVVKVVYDLWEKLH